MNRAPQSGVTLVEMLVVLVLIAILAGVAVAALGGADRRGDASHEAQRLASRLNLAVDEALVTGTVLALSWNERGYRFERWNSQDGEWQRYDIDLLGQRHTLDSSLQLTAGRRENNQQQRLPIAPNGIGDSATLAITGTASDWQVSFDGLSAHAMPLDGR